MKRTLLVINSDSGNAGSVDGEALATAFNAAGFDIVGKVTLPADALPTRTDVEAHDINTVAVCAGDGTISWMCVKLAGWEGEIFVLPGGTMNLLSRRLHGEYTLAEVIDLLPSINSVAAPVPVILLDDVEILTGLTVGPSARWGKVREGIRQADVTSLSETVPEAWSETLGKDGVWLSNMPDEAYAGIFIEPVDADNIRVIAFKAHSLGDMVNHGLAWLRRDFREGPRDGLGLMHSATVVGDPAETGILVDGEYADRTLPVTCHAAMSSARFLRISA